jgi:hypothetical protein
MTEEAVSTVPSIQVPEPTLVFSDTLSGLNGTRTKLARDAWQTFVGSNKPPFLHFAEKEKVVQLSAEDWGLAENWFVLGDIHGDFYALYNALKYVQEVCPDFRLVFLGDLIDRGPHPMECLWLLLAYAKRFPNRIMWLAGNHDVSIQELPDKSFWAAVEPSEFLEHLNRLDSWTPFRRRFGNEFIELVKDLPRAALSPDGLLFTHGGIPHVDLQKDLTTKVTTEERTTWLNSTEALQDFTWTRITRFPRRIPNRISTGCSYGYADFAAFCEATKDFFPATRLVTGHEHPTSGFDTHPEWKTLPALTLKGFGFANDYENAEAFNSHYLDNLVVGRCRRDDIPEVIQIPVDRNDLSAFFEKEITRWLQELHCHDPNAVQEPTGQC